MDQKLLSYIWHGVASSTAIFGAFVLAHTLGSVVMEIRS